MVVVVPQGASSKKPAPDNETKRRRHRRGKSAVLRASSASHGAEDFLRGPVTQFGPTQYYLLLSRGRAA